MRARLLSVMLAVVAGVVVLRASDWPEWRGPARDGASLELTLDADLQSIVDNHLARAVDTLGAKRGFAIFLDPWTGELGHSWNLFRWSQWAYPFVLVLQVAGLLRLRALLPVAFARASLVGLLAVACALAGMHWGWSRPLGLSMRRVIASETPYSPRLSPC